MLEQTKTLRVRTDAEVWFVLDVSRSMLAQADTGSPTRLDRAKAAASTFRASLSGTPVGIASMTTRVLPHLFPGANEDVFQTTLDRSLGIERPPPPSGLATVATDLSSLGMIRGLRYFSPSTKKRLVVVFTDGESTAVSNARVGTIYRQTPAIGLGLRARLEPRRASVHAQHARGGSISPIQPRARLSTGSPSRRAAPSTPKAISGRPCERVVSSSAMGRPPYGVRADAASRWRRTSRSSRSFR